MMRKSELASLAGVLLFSLILHPVQGDAQGTKVYTLKESISEALTKNWSLKAKKEEIEQATMVKYQARAEFLPKLSTSYGYTRLGEEKTFRSTLMPGQEIAVSSKNNYQWKGTVTQPVFTGFGLTSSYELAKLGIVQSEAQLQLEKLDLALKVKEAYFGILKADKGLEVAEKAVKSLEANVEVARNFYKVGMIPVNDLLKAEVELANARHDLVKARNASRLARCNFNTVLSRPINESVEVEEVLTYKPLAGNFQDYLTKALEGRPETRIIDIRILETEQQIRLAKSKNYPEIGVTCEYIKEGNTPNVSGSDFHDASDWQAAAYLSWTFWEWGKTHYSGIEKQGLKRELLKTREALTDGIRLELKDAMLALEVADKNIPTTEKAVEQAEENLRVSQERYKAQVTTMTEVLDAQTLLTRARTNHYNALYDHHLAKARLLRAIGAY